MRDLVEIVADAAQLAQRMRIKLSRSIGHDDVATGDEPLGDTREGKAADRGPQFELVVFGLGDADRDQSVSDLLGMGPASWHGAS